MIRAVDFRELLGCTVGRSAGGLLEVSSAGVLESGSVGGTVNVIATGGCWGVQFARVR